MLQEISFDLKKAYHAKQAAYDEMANAREKTQELNSQQAEKWNEAQELQAQYDEAKEAQDSAWQEYNDKQNDFRALIGNQIDAINECNKLEAVLRERVTDNPRKAEMYEAGAKYFSSLAKHMVVERDRLISMKRSMLRPDNSRCEQILEKLKYVRAEHKELLENYHHAKNEFNLKQQEFNRLNQKYLALASPDMVLENDENSNNYTSRPKRLEVNESLLLEADIPELFWGDTVAEQRADGMIDIYYARSLGNGHGHVILNPDHSVNYHREPVA